MKREKELSGTKSSVKIQCQIRKPIKSQSWINIPKQFHRLSDGYTKNFTHVIKVDVIDIDDKNKLAFVIRKHYGYGHFNVLFYNRWCKSSKYNPRFKCLIQRNKECKYKPSCRIYSRHKKGWSCKMNRRYRPNWSKRASIIIYPSNDFMSEKDYEFKWDKRSDMMHFFNRWFWRGGR